MVKEYLKNKINVIVEKAFTREVFLREFVKGFNKKSRLFIYQLHAPEKIREVRVKQRPLLSYSKKRLTKEKIKRNTRHFNEFRFKNAREFDTGKLSTHKIVKEIMKVVK